MLFYSDLENVIFARHELVECDEMVIISGYVGPSPIRKLDCLPIKSTVIYGMYGADGIRKSLHDNLTSFNTQSSKVDVFYSKMPIHAKCYMWMNKGKVVSALIGSANFSTNGLTTPYKETLADATKDTFSTLRAYYDTVKINSIICTDGEYKENSNKGNRGEDTSYNKDVCTLPLYIHRNGSYEVPRSSHLNWGMSALNGSHVNIDDAYLKISSEALDHYPLLFPKKLEEPSAGTKVGRMSHRHNDNIEVIWDDGTTMTCLLEGSIARTVNGVEGLYPKQIASTPSKAELGQYLRGRLGVPSGQYVTYQDLLRYGRTSIDISLQGEGVYYFDFSVK